MTKNLLLTAVVALGVAAAPVAALARHHHHRHHGMSTSNNQPGTTAGTPVHSVPSDALPGNSNADQSGK